MPGLGRKTFSSGEVLTAANVQGYLMDQAVMVFDGTASRGSAIPTPSAGMVAYSTATQLQVYNGSAWVDLSTGYGVATGGSSSSITVSSVNYTLLTFTSSSTLTVTKAGLFDVMLVAGGGAGGNDDAATGGGGGGGAGGLITGTIYLAANATVTVGAGGAANPATSGASSYIGTQTNGISVAGGGHGGGYGPAPMERSQAARGGSGGGAGGFGGPAATSMAPGVTGNNGASNGGGGSSGNASGNTGGAGTDVSTFISGGALTKAVGGNGVSGATAGGANTGTGGAGRNSGGGTGGAGGSGIVYVRFKV